MKTVHVLNKNWSLKQADSQAEYQIPHMPMQVHEILYYYDRISDGYLRGKTGDCAWVNEKTWIYETVFDLGEDNAFLEFEGLDTICSIVLNGEEIAASSDAFLPEMIDITGKAVKGKNILQLVFPPLEKELDRIRREYSFMFEADPAWNAARFVRKTHHDFDTYLGNDPNFYKVGVFKDVRLVQLPEKVMLQTPRIDYSLNERMDFAQIQVIPRLQTGGREGIPEDLICEAAVSFEGNVVAKQAVRAGEKLDFAINDPNLWWPRGFGKPNLYEISVCLKSRDEEIIDEITVKTGLRDIQMPEMLHFYINRKSIRLWGANFTPDEGHTLVENTDRLIRLMDLAMDANCNVIRIWGEGVPVSDAVYEYADKNGLMIWQEFFLGNAWYPYVKEFVDKVMAESRYLIDRLRDHPSIILWCGGNECFLCRDFIDQEKEYEASRLLEYDLKRLCKEMDPARYYHINSPYFGAYANDPMAGDTHSYTNSWYVPGGDCPIFVSENLRVSFPKLKSLQKYMESGELPECGMYKNGMYPWPKEYERITSAESYKKVGPYETFYDAENAEEMIYRFGSAAGVYLKDSIERYRRGKTAAQAHLPRRNMGHLVWKLNTTFPHVYSSMVDYYLEPKINYFYVKRAYEPFILSIEAGDHLLLWAVNDCPDMVNGTVIAGAFDIDANQYIREARFPLQVRADESMLVANLDIFGQLTRSTVIFARLIDENGNIIARTHQFLDIERHIRYQDAHLQVRQDDDSIVISSDVFARSVELEADHEEHHYWDFSDNYFDIFPGEEVRVKVRTAEPEGTVRMKAFYGSHEEILKFKNLSI